MSKSTYTIVVDNDRDDEEGPFTAYVPKDWGDPMHTPWKTTGETKPLALSALAKVLGEWHEGGAERWLSTPQGQQFEDHFTMGEPLPGAPDKAKA